MATRDAFGHMIAWVGKPARPPLTVFAPWVDALFGSANVRRVAQKLRASGVSASAIWTEDWRGGADGAFGYGLEEDWRVDRTLYPDFEQLANDLRAQGFAFLTDEYLLGDRILVAPVQIEGATSRQVMLPAGTWYPLLGGPAVAGGEITASASRTEIPAFVPAGILYGVTGEGLGHAMRSRVMAEHLRAAGHEVKLVASGRACAYLERHLDDVELIPGLSMTYVRDSVARLRTAARIGRTARPVVRETMALYRRSISGFQPDVCLTDFDSFSHVFGLLFARPVISLDHQHVISRCRHTPAVKRALPRDFPLTRAFVRAKLPGCRHYVVTSFYFPALRRDRTTLVGPILRPEVLALAPTRGDHLLVYQTATAPPELLDALRANPQQRFIVYGRGQPSSSGNVEIRAFDEARFLEDLAGARAVICNGGYTLMSEALYLGKPVLSLPLRHQGEQELNAAYLVELGLGRSMRRIDPHAIRDFVATESECSPMRIPAGNSRAIAVIDSLLEKAS